LIKRRGASPEGQKGGFPMYPRKGKKRKIISRRGREEEGRERKGKESRSLSHCCGPRKKVRGV